jgi:hypothetical protein
MADTKSARASEGASAPADLSESLITALALCKDHGEVEVAEHVLEALRTLHARNGEDAPQLVGKRHI